MFFIPRVSFNHFEILSTEVLLPHTIKILLIEVMRNVKGNVLILNMCITENIKCCFVIDL